MTEELIRYEDFLENPEQYLKSRDSYWWFSGDLENQKDPKTARKINITKIYLEQDGEFHVLQGMYNGEDNQFFFNEMEYQTPFSKERMLAHRHFNFLKGKEGKIARGNQRPF